MVIICIVGGIYYIKLSEKKIFMYFIVKFKIICMKFLFQIWILYIFDIIEYMCFIYVIIVFCLFSILINIFINNNKKINFKISIVDILLKCVYKYVIRKYKNCISNKIKKIIVLFLEDFL